MNVYSLPWLSLMTMYWKASTWKLPSAVSTTVTSWKIETVRVFPAPGASPSWTWKVEPRPADTGPSAVSPYVLWDALYPAPPPSPPGPPWSPPASAPPPPVPPPGPSRSARPGPEAGGGTAPSKLARSTGVSAPAVATPKAAAAAPAPRAALVVAARRAIARIAAGALAPLSTALRTRSGTAPRTSRLASSHRCAGMPAGGRLPVDALM